MASDGNKRKGFLVGKFAPLHKGHEYFIRSALKQCDELCVILSHDQRFLDSIPKEIRDRFRPSQRYFDVSVFLSKLGREFPDKKLLFIAVDESNIPYYPNGWPEFVELCLTEMQSKQSYTPNAVFSSETAYDSHYKQYLPQCEHVIIDAERNAVHISATEIRNQLLEIQNSISQLAAVVDSNILRSLVIVP